VILNEITLINWQSYKGEGNTFDFRGPDGTNNSAVLLARNAKGKSAFFDAFRFLFYGRGVVVDRDSTTTPKRVKPLVSEKKGMKPLMCFEAWSAGEKLFGVKGKFSVGEDEFTIERTYKSTKPKPAETDLSATFFISDSEKADIPNPEEFIKLICPVDITKFFTIDGELLITYRQMFSTERPGLATDIEKILRMDLLDVTSHHLKSIERKQKAVKRKEENNITKGGKHESELADLRADINETEDKLEDNIAKKEKAVIEKNEIYEWIQTKGNTIATAKKLDQIETDEKSIRKEIDVLIDSRAKQMGNSWKQVLNLQFKTAAESQQQILDRQKANEEEIGRIRSKLESKTALLEDKKCPSCEKITSLSPSEKHTTSHEILDLERELDGLISLSGTPSPYPIMEQINLFRNAITDTKYESINSISNEISKKKIQLITLGEDRKVTMADLKPDALKLGRDKQKRYDQLANQISTYEDLIRQHTRQLEYINTNYDTLEKKNVGKGDTSTVKKAKESLALIEALGNICQLAKDPFRDKTRRSVSNLSEEAYLSMIEDDHDSMEIDSSFRLKVKHENKDTAILTPGQMGLATYCILDALSVISDVKFPLIVDSPGQGIDMVYMSKIFKHILGESSRQVIVLPTNAEMNSDTVVADYGASVASIYQLQRPPDSKETSIVEIHRRAP
jgi:DNA sulfur modification protein DndD